MAVKSYDPDIDFVYKCTVTLAFRGMTMGQGHDTSVGHGQQLCEILSRSNLAVKSYCPDTHILLCLHFDLDLGSRS